MKPDDINDGIRNYQKLGKTDIEGISDDEMLNKLTAESAVWEFGGELININTGEPASADEVAAFRERQALREQISLRATVKQKKIDKEWNEKYEKKIREYFEIDPDEDGGYDMYVHYNDDDALVYSLSTRIFDIVGWRDYYKDPNGDGYMYRDEHPIKTYEAFMAYVDSSAPDLREEINEIKKMFPDHFRDAVVGFVDGNHDT